jgi:predicted  nucleic acid-binding Zn-ribbon protein
MQTKQDKLNKLNEDIVTRGEYLKSIEVQIEQFSEIANNRLFELNGQIDKAEKELAKVLKRSYEIDQHNREKLHIV